MTKFEMFAAISEKFNPSYVTELFDPEYRGGMWMIEAVETKETLEQWDDSKKYWNECAGRVEGTVAGFRFLGWKKVQMEKGDTRRSVTVVDFGEFRVVLDCDPSNF